MEGAELFGKFPADLRRNRCILQEQGALEELATVQSGAEDEVTMEQGSGLFEEGEDVGHWEREGFRLKTVRLLGQRNGRDG